MSQTYQEAIENSNIISKTNTDGIITFVNDEFCKISGYTKEELVGSDHNIVRHPDVPKGNFTLLWDTILSKKSFKTTVKNLCKNGSAVYLNTTITPILDENDEIKEFIAIRYDVTKEVELKKDLEKKDLELEILNRTLEQRVREQTAQLLELNLTLEQRVTEEILKNKEKQKILFLQSRMASLGQMLENIAHQWRQPLTELSIIIFNIKKSAKNKNLNKLDEYYKESLCTIENMSQTIDDFTNFFNPNKEKENFFIDYAIDEALIIINKLLKKENINIIKKYEKLKLLGVVNELAQVIINLIQNSSEAFGVNKNNFKSINIEILKKDKYAIIKYFDNAGGTTNEVLDKLFEPYFTTKYQSNGTGLGLFISKMIIEKSLNGTLEAKNIEDGLQFTIKIPLEGKNVK